MLKLLRSFRLGDESHHSAVSADGRRFVASSGAGRCVLFDEHLRELHQIALQGKVEWVQLSNDGSVLLAGFADHIDGYEVTGREPTRSLTLPVAGTSFLPCVFSLDEPVVCIASWDEDPILAAYDLRSSELIAEQRLPARGGEGYSLVPHPEGEAIAAVAFSGQSEEWLFWAHYRGGRIRVFDRPEIEDVSLPNFDPSGAEFVSHHESLGLCRMRFPTGELIGHVRPEDAFPDNPEDVFGYDMHYLSPERLLAWQTSLALYEFDLNTLRATRCVLAGVDEKTFGQDGFFSGQSWEMAGTRLLTSDRQLDRNFRNATTTLRLWDASGLFGPSVLCDPERPLTKQLLATE